MHKKIQEIRQVLEAPGGNMDLTGLPGAEKLLSAGPLLLSYLNETGHKGYFGGLILREMEAVHYLHGFRAVVDMWRQIADRLLALMPDDAYLGCVISGFVIHGWGDDSVAISEQLSEQIELAMAKPIRLVSGAVVTVTYNYGFVVYPDDCGPVTDHTEITKYVATVARADGVQRFSRELRDQIQRREQIKAELPGALAEHRLRFVYQPQVDLYTGKTVGAEVLVRWRDDELGDISPEEFVPIAERTGDIVELTRQSIARAVRAAGHLAPELPFRLSVNVSKALFNYPDFDLFRYTRSLLKSTKCPPGRLHFEITETAYFDTPVARRAHAIVKRLSRLGIGVVVDDFGTGYGSLPLLSSGTIECIKLDKGLTQSLTAGKDDHRFLNALCLVLEELNIELIAEGVETEEQAIALMNRGVHLVQGYLFAEPMECEQMLQFLLTDSAVIEPFPKG
ncbi:MAG: hypothetical protein DHS20C11_13670 [Lysobacteraceae bacterium]|nr:MAG: hypothetical protein DHS20C11_13670 [Xanthomonadaceae bacterium]